MTTDKIIILDGHEYRVVATGAQREDSTYCHLASTTLGRQQKNGWVPAQIGDWVPNQVLAAPTSA